MTRYGNNLEYCLQKQGYDISKESIYNLGLKLLNIFEHVHNSGYTYNDLKPDNILLGYGESLPNNCTIGNCFENNTIALVDFGFASEYRD